MLFDENGKFLKQYNRYEIKDNYVIGYTNKNEPFYVDLEDYDKVKQYCWHIDSNGYLRTSIHYNKKHSGVLLLHDYIMNRDNNSKLVVDHIHGKHTINDNRKSNLRLVPQYINCINQPNRKDNKSGIKGVNWSKEHNKWTVRISVNHNRLFLGRYDSLKEAKRIREQAEEKYYGEYSYKNSINK